MTYTLNCLKWTVSISLIYSKLETFYKFSNFANLKIDKSNINHYEHELFIRTRL